jgi:Flp pilus assembly protein TadD
MDDDQANGPAEAADGAEDATRQARRAARTAMKQGDVSAAITQLEAAAAESPHDLAVLTLLARALAKIGRVADLEAVDRRVLEQDPGNAKARARLGEAAWKRGERSEALEHFQAGANAHPDDAKVNQRLGQALLSEWRIDEAEAALRRVIAVVPGDVTALQALARCAGIRGDGEDAEAYLRAAAASQPGNRKIELKIKRLEVSAADHDWNKEVLDATAVLRNADSPPGERFSAAQLLLAYGVTDVVLEICGPLEASLPAARRLVQMARQLDRSGLSQPSRPPGQAADPEIDELNTITGVVERLKPGADTLMLVFSGRLNRAFLSLDILHRLMRNTGASLVYLRDLERTNYLGGVVGLGEDFAATTEAFRALMARSGARRLLMFGNCVGCAGALRYGLALGAEAVLGISPRVGAAAKQGLSAATASKLEALVGATPQFAGDVTSLYLAAGASAPRVALVAGAGAEPEASFARDMAARVPGVVYAAMPGVNRECFGAILAQGLFPALVASFVADGSIAPDVVNALGRPAPPAREAFAARMASQVGASP